MAYLDANPPNHQQFRCPRRERPSGVIGVHTAESFPDESGPDTGAENVADFIRRRGNYGSYHLLADSDSIVQLVEFRCVAYHIATHGLNEHTIGISAATQAHKWNSLGDDWVRDTVRNMARAAARAARWLQEHYDITVPARRISLAQALRGERGFLAHGDADPARRTDPGSTFPWGDFLSYYAAENGDDDVRPSDWNAEDIDQVQAILNNAIIKHTDKNFAWHLRRILALLGRPVRWADGEDRTDTHTLSWLQRAVTTMIDAQEGSSGPAILAKLDEIAAADAQRDQAILEAIGQIEDGNTEAALARLRDLLETALPDDEN